MIPKLEEIKHHYIEYRTGRYLIEHPQASPTKARKYARVAWHRKIKQWEQRRAVESKGAK